MPTNSYVVTGGAGFIGSHLVENLLDAGEHVKVIDNFTTGFESNLTDLPKTLRAKLDIIRGDIRDAQVLGDAMHGVSGVFHLAAMVSVPLSIEQPDLSFDINARGSVVMASSAAV